MNRLQRECLAASLVFHTGLLVLLVVGAGFTSGRKTDTVEVPILTFFPDTLVDSPIVGGGNPPSQPPRQPPNQPPSQPPAQPEAPPPRPTEPAKAEPAVEKDVSPPKVAEAKRAPSASAPDPNLTSPTGEKPAPRHKIEVNLKPVEISAAEARAQRERAAAAAQARRQAETQRLAERQRSRVAGVVGALEDNLSSGTTVSVPGTGGATYASYTSFVDLIYRRAWAPLKPRETGDTGASVLVRVVIARDGAVISDRITKRSGDAALDKSVQAALDRVRTIGRPFPDGAKDTQREFEIEFNLESRGGAG